jgi:hypothetical protein
VTICVHDRSEWFGRVVDGTVALNDIGAIADERRQWLDQQYPFREPGIQPVHAPDRCIATPRSRSATLPRQAMAA